MSIITASATSSPLMRRRVSWGEISIDSFETEADTDDQVEAVADDFKAREDREEEPAADCEDGLAQLRRWQDVADRRKAARGTTARWETRQPVVLQPISQSSLASRRSKLRT